jgi:hypothetical protein
MTTYLRQHGLMSFISLNIPEREINLHFVNSAGLQQNAPFCALLKNISFFHGFIILISSSVVNTPSFEELTAG